MPRTPIHPGETRRDDLETLGMSAANLSRQIKVPVNRMTHIMNGSRAITGNTALRLAYLSKGKEVESLPVFGTKLWAKRHKKNQPIQATQ